MLEKLIQEKTTLENEINELVNEKALIDDQSEIKKQELKDINDESARIQSLLIQKNRILNELKIVEEWLTAQETF